MEGADRTQPAPENWRPRQPPWRTTSSGAARRVGVEIELIGPDVQEATAVLTATLSGEPEIISRYETIVRGDAAGPWRVELDFRYLKEQGRERADSQESLPLLRELSERLLRAGAEALVPVELVSPPLPLPRLADAQRLVRALQRCGARGTKAGITYAFGMQLNPEMPRLDADTVLAYLRAFACAYDWLLRESRVDLTRRLTGYMAPFPKEYVRHIVDLGYRPDLDALIDDYLQANPTRNRALDLLPLFAELDEGRVRRVVRDTLVKARPALHYRLPNSEVDDPSWGIHLAWRNWLQVEHLAADPSRLEGACAAYAEFLDQARLKQIFDDWAEGVAPWLIPVDDLGSV